LEGGEDVLVSGFGKFCVKEKKRRRGRNPATGDVLILNERRVVTFKVSSVLKDKINEGT
jgi:integration host factor subunit alpha